MISTMSDRPIYLDHHSTTPVDPRVLQEMLPWFSEKFGNASSIGHTFGEEAREAVESAREKIASLIGAEPREIVFTSGATESDNLALKGVMLAHPPGSHLIVAAGEHRAVLDPADRLARLGYRVTKVPIDSTGQISPESIAAAIEDQTVLVSVMWANHEVGTINPVEAIGRLCDERNLLFHCDAVQAAGKIPVDARRTPIDLLSISAHKLYGPKGVGALFVRRGIRRIPLVPQIDGGGQEQNYRSGTLPVPLIVGFGAACEIAEREMPEEAARLGGLRDRLWGALQRELDGLHRHGHPAECLPHNLNVGFEDVDGDAVLAGLHASIAVSTGSACTSSDPEPSAVLRAMGVPDHLARASLRFGLGRNNTEEEIDRAVEQVVNVVRRLRSRQNPAEQASST